MNINNVNSTTPLQNTPGVSTPKPAVVPEQPPRASDRLQLSGQSHLLSALKSNSGIRADKVQAIKNQIANGTYDENAKLDGVLDKVLEDLNK